MIRLTNKICRESWKNYNWKKARRNVFRLQKRIYKAMRAGDTRKVRNLQKLLMKSQSAMMLAIRQVTQLNKGKKTAGIDGKTALNFKERFELLDSLQKNSENWKHQGLREIPIPKKNGKTRILKVPTIADRTWQCLIKYALEPAHEATFSNRSYGFRIGRSAHDAQKLIFNNLRSFAKGKGKRVIELDIRKCFDRISHEIIMDNLIAPKSIKLGIFRCLKAGINPEFPNQGTPQGGVVSPLLANIALNGIEEVAQKGYTKNQIKHCKSPQSLRYADDMVIILKPEHNAQEILDNVKEFLAKRGMEISEEKTKITRATDGFDFLGWNFFVQENGKFRSTPSEDNYQAFREKVKNTVNSSNYGAEDKAKKLASVVRGWRNYHKYCKMDGSRNSLWFIQNRAWKVFNKQAKLDRYSTTKLIEKSFPSVPYSENKFVMVKGDKSPYDGDIAYWSKRNSKLYDNHTAKALKRQNHTCGHCGLHLMPGEKVHLHHIDGNHSNWKRTNLLAVHESCHKNIHMGTRDKKEKVTEKAVNNSHVTNRRMNDSLCQSQKRRLSLLIPRSRVR